MIPDANDPRLKAFNTAYLKRFGQEPDVYASHAFDGMNIIIEAIKKAGLNRVLIRDVLTDMKTFNGYQGVTGKVIFDDTWNNIRPIFMAKVINGKFEFSPAPKWEKDDKIYKKASSGY